MKSESSPVVRSPARVCVITGATSGIGRATALRLAARGDRLVLVGRQRERGQTLRDRLCRKHGAESTFFIEADLMCEQQVAELALQIRNRFPVVDVLVNNAGARFDSYGTNSKGIERTFAGNHLGHFLLTALLLERLLGSSEGRIVTLGSGAHNVSPPVGWILTEANYDRKLAYGGSKLANIMFAYELARRLKDTTVTVNAFDPGGVATRLGMNNGLKAWLKHVGYYLRKRQLIFPGRAAGYLSELCSDPRMRRQTGGYYSGTTKIKSASVSYDASLSRELWQISVNTLGLTEERLGNAWRYFQPDGVFV